MFDRPGQVVGYVMPTGVRRGSSSVPHHLILLAESQYWGNEAKVEFSGLLPYNVMVVEWDTQGAYAGRVRLEGCGWEGKKVKSVEGGACAEGRRSQVACRAILL